MVVASGSFPSAFFNTHNSQRLASRVLVDLLVHSPSSVGAASRGELRNESKGQCHHLAVVRGWWSAIAIILLWSGVGG